MMIKDGFVTAQSDGFSVDVRGKGGHGARPHEAVDAIVIASAFIDTAQTLVSRRVDPLHPSVVTIGKVEAGSAPNVIAERAHLEGTVRTTLTSIRDKIHRGLRGTAKALAESHDAIVDIDIEEGYPPVENAPEPTGWARRIAEDVLGEAQVRESEHPSMGAEDFAYFLGRMPGAYIRLGARPADGEYLPLHSPSFTIDEKALEVGTGYLDRLARGAIARLGRDS
ncbi:MAG: M20 family metallopeptidase [Bradymonadaceae bacterium]